MAVVRYLGSVVCKAPSYKTALRHPSENIIINTFQPANVTFRISCDRKPINIKLNPPIRDLLDLAIAVYISDEHVKRASSDDRWSRNFYFIFPVDNPKSWKTNENLLKKMLHFLSGDYFSFDWEKSISYPPRQRHRARLPNKFDTVCLFSGGIDSLLGAYQLLRQRRKVILVGHQADSIAASTQWELAQLLKNRFPGQVVLAQCRVARSLTANPRYPLPEKVEHSHRPRSFLFLCLAFAMASHSRIDSVMIPENGLIALNIPLQLSRVGTLSTRTAHPAYLDLILQTVQKLTGYRGELKNPFLYQSKTDMLKRLDPEILELLKKTVSCAHPDVFRWAQARGKKHCGYCVPCIYRRLAIAETTLDQSRDYVVDPFVQFLDLSATKRADLYALTQFAKRVIKATKAERQTMILEHGAFPADIGKRIGLKSVTDYSEWADMIFRWADDFIKKATTWSPKNTKRLLGI